MRKIKFRAWNKEKNIMVYGHEDGSDDYWDGVCSSDVEIINDIFSSDIENETHEFMQYTGVKDKNGIEIYEGDIIKIQSMVHDNYPVYVGKVVFENGAYMCNSKWNTHWIGDMFLSKEILGNIYENPELLEGNRL